MGMFDSLIAADGSDWQTKALIDPYLHTLHIGDRVDVAGPNPECYEDYQLLVLGDDGPCAIVERYATIHGGRLAAVPVDRDPSLPLAYRHGGFPATGLPEHTSGSQTPEKTRQTVPICPAKS